MTPLLQRLLLFLLIFTCQQSWAYPRRRSTNGNIVKDISQYPWSARLKSVDCSASIIDPYLVLTAARCVCGKKVSSLTVTVGSTFTDERKKVEVPAAAAGVFIHPYFANCTRTDDYDMAVIRTAKRIPFGNNVNEIIICPSTCYRPGMKGMFVGYGGSRHGKSNVLRYGTGNIDTCGQRFCIHKGGSEFHKSDSGGPLLISCKIDKGISTICQLAISTNNDGEKISFTQVYALQQFPGLLSSISIFGDREHEGRGKGDEGENEDD